MEKSHLNVNLILCCRLIWYISKISADSPTAFSGASRSTGKPDLQVPGHGFSVLLLPGITEEGYMFLCSLRIS